MPTAGEVLLVSAAEEAMEVPEEVEEMEVEEVEGYKTPTSLVWQTFTPEPAR
ncbi:hypothetical protein J6590_032359 [Homalodisca vitripennis]|nr:hypothetical protein J6590_032359 [Homalodisca vitripennis]